MRRILACVGLVLGVLSLGVPGAGASKPPHHQVTLCHRTGSATGGNQHNGYSIITVDIASVANAKDVRGHDHHDHVGNGPIGDIIPSYTYGTFTYPGKNLENGGQAFLDNGCHAAVTTTTTQPCEVNCETTTTESIPTTTVCCETTTSLGTGTTQGTTGPRTGLEIGTATATSNDLPRTGTSTVPLVIFALVLIASGLMLLLGRRRAVR